ncbi:MAG: response regulator [Myxococcales bacterium]|nr:response regulator [Myxococcales bacterium]
MSEAPAAELFGALGRAVRSGQERFVLHARVGAEAARLAATMQLEGQIETADSLGQALALLGEQPFDFAVLDPEREALDVDPLEALRELGAKADLAFLMEPAPERVSEAFARGLAAALPRPLPENEALLRAHVRWLISLRRARSRGILLRGLLARHRGILERHEPAMLAALEPLIDDAAPAMRVWVLGDPDLVQAVGGGPAETTPDVVVVAAHASDGIEARLAEARTRAAGAAVILVDAAPEPARVLAAIYGGARAYVVRARGEDLPRALKLVGARRQAEAAGRRLIEGLARFGLLEHRGQAPVPSRDLGARMIADVTSRGSPFVPSGHEVLVVDDEVVVLTVLREALRRGGYNVTTAASAEEAIALLKQKVFDLVLTDKNLTGASGLDVLRFARTLTPEPAVVLITGYSSYDSAVEAMETGALDYIEKPIKDVELLRQRIRRALCRRDEQMSRVPLPELTASKPRVLLVEEQEVRRQPLAEFLGRTYEVVAVANGTEALLRLEQERFDVVLADRNLPGMTGKRVIEQAQQLLPHCASVLYTAYPSYESIQEAFEVGADAYLVRPTEDMKALEDKVAGALRSRGILLG